MTDKPTFTVLCSDDDADTRLSVSLDVSLPDISGVEVCRRIKADAATSLRAEGAVGTGATFYFTLSPGDDA